MIGQESEVSGAIGELSFWGSGTETSGDVIINIIPTDPGYLGATRFHVGAVGANEYVSVTCDQFHKRLVVFMTLYGTGLPLMLRYREIGGALPEVFWVEGAD